MLFTGQTSQDLTNKKAVEDSALEKLRNDIVRRALANPDFVALKNKFSQLVADSRLPALDDSQFWSRDIIPRLGRAFRSARDYLTDWLKEGYSYRLVDVAAKRAREIFDAFPLNAEQLKQGLQAAAEEQNWARDWIKLIRRNFPNQLDMGRQFVGFVEQAAADTVSGKPPPQASPGPSTEPLPQPTTEIPAQEDQQPSSNYAGLYVVAGVIFIGAIVLWFQSRK